MGNTSSTQNFINNSTNINISQSYVTKNLLGANQNSTNIVSLKIKFGYADGCPVDTSQTIQNNQTLVTSLNNTNNVQFANELQQSLESTLTQNANMVNGFAAATGGNSTNVTNSITNTIKEKITQTLTNENIMKIAQSSYNEITGEVTYEYCKNSPVKMNQSIVSNIISQNILTNVSNAIMKDSTVQKLVSYADQKASQENQGLNNVIDAIGKALSGIIGSFTGPMAAIPIAACILCCVCCLALLYFMMSPAGQQTAVIGAQAGANSLGHAPVP